MKMFHVKHFLEIYQWIVDRMNIENPVHPRFQDAVKRGNNK